MRLIKFFLLVFLFLFSRLIIAQEVEKKASANGENSLVIAAGIMDHRSPETEQIDAIPIIVEKEVKKQFLKLIWVSVVGGITIGWLMAVFTLMSLVRKKIKKSLEEKFYSVDARSLKVWVPENDFDNELQILKKWDFNNIKTYSYPSKSTFKNGCIVFKCTTPDEEDDLEKLAIELQQDKSVKIGVIAYTSGENHRL